MPSRRLRTGRPPLTEFGLISDIRRRFGRTGPAVRAGIGDDTAVIRLPSRRDLLLTTDLLAEGVHFTLDTADFEDIGYKAAVANLSDIAAMGGVPRYVLVALAIPPSRTASEIARLYRGMMEACRLYSVQLVGGDTSASQQGLFISLTLTGTVRPGRALTRSGARNGDLIYVTGTLGDSLAGLTLLTQGDEGPGPPLRDRRYLLARHRRPTPRIADGQALLGRRLATAAIDVSDGLSGDLSHVCEQSGVGAEVHATAIPLSPACRVFAEARGLDPTALALQGGEDYELLFTASPGNQTRIERLARRMGFRWTCIGRIRPRAFGLRLRHADGRSRPLPISSYQHFRPQPVTQHEAACSR